jgi:hypothetical protein
MFGIMLLAILLLRRRLVPLLVVSTLGGLFCSIYRIVYGPIIIVAAIYAYSLGKGYINKKFLKRLLIISLVIVLLLLIIPEGFLEATLGLFIKIVKYHGFGDISQVARKAGQQRLIQHSSWLASVPERVMLGLMSPFPWTPILKVENMFEFFSALVDYLHTALMVVCFAAIAVFGLRNLKEKVLLPSSVVFSLLIAASGMFGTAIHNVYVQIGMLFSFPYVLNKLGKKRMLDWFLISVSSFIILSVLWHYAR